MADPRSRFCDLEDQLVDRRVAARSLEVRGLAFRVGCADPPILPAIESSWHGCQSYPCAVKPVDSYLDLAYTYFGLLEASVYEAERFLLRQLDSVQPLGH